jgi:hypothetical protein
MTFETRPEVPHEHQSIQPDGSDPAAEHTIQPVIITPLRRSVRESVAPSPEQASPITENERMQALAALLGRRGELSVSAAHPEVEYQPRDESITETTIDAPPAHPRIKDIVDAEIVESPAEAAPVSSTPHDAPTQADESAAAASGTDDQPGETLDAEVKDPDGLWRSGITGEIVTPPAPEPAPRAAERPTDTPEQQPPVYKPTQPAEASPEATDKPASPARPRPTPRARDFDVDPRSIYVTAEDPLEPPKEQPAESVVAEEISEVPLPPAPEKQPVAETSEAAASPPEEPTDTPAEPAQPAEAPAEVPLSPAEVLARKEQARREKILRNSMPDPEQSKIDILRDNARATYLHEVNQMGELPKIIQNAGNSAGVILGGFARFFKAFKKEIEILGVEAPTGRNGKLGFYNVYFKSANGVRVKSFLKRSKEAAFELLKKNGAPFYKRF